MNKETKLEKYYKPEKMRTALFKMEQFFSIWHDSSVDDKHRTAAKKLFEHYRRLAMCILAKEFDEAMEVERVLTPAYIDSMFDGTEDNNAYSV